MRAAMARSLHGSAKGRLVANFIDRPVPTASVFEEGPDIGAECRDGTANQHSEAICSKIEDEQDGADPKDSVEGCYRRIVSPVWRPPRLAAFAADPLP